MTYLVDTNVVSEFVKPRPSEAVLRWLNGVDGQDTFLSAITLAELRRGVDLLEPGARRKALDIWLRVELPVRFEGRVISIDAAIANAWGELLAQARKRGIALEAFDGFIAATALVHAHTVATRNTRDFERVGVKVFNPWLH